MSERYRSGNRDFKKKRPRDGKAKGDGPGYGERKSGSERFHQGERRNGIDRPHQTERSDGDNRPRQSERKGGRQRKEFSGRGGKREDRGGKNAHDPSRYRAIVRESKKGNRVQDISALLREAKDLRDPYYTSLALVALSASPGLSLDKATSTAEQGIGFANRENRTWRKVELLLELQKKLTGWRAELDEVGVDEVQNHLQAKVLELIVRLPPGKPRSDAIMGLATRVDGKNVGSILRLALEDRGSELEDARVVLRSWAKTMREKGEGGIQGPGDEVEDSYIEIISHLKEVKDTKIRSRLFGYLHFQIGKNRLHIIAKTAFDHALDAIDDISEKRDQIEEFRYLSTVSKVRNELTSIKDGIAAIDEAGHVVRGFTSLAGRADKCGFQDLTLELLETSRERLAEIDDLIERNSAGLNIAKGFHLCGSEEDSVAVFKIARDDLVTMAGEEMIRAGSRTISAMRRLGFPEDDPIVSELIAYIGGPGGDELDEKGSVGDGGRDGNGVQGESTVNEPEIPQVPDKTPPLIPESSETIGETSDIETSTPIPGPQASFEEPGMKDEKKTSKEEKPTGNHVLALYDAYEGGLKPTHYRAIARAAPLCYAYDLDLALVGFPADDLDLIVKETIAETNVGRGGKLLEVLHSEGRLHLVPATAKEPPTSWNDLGFHIATTSHPDPRKRVYLTEDGVQPGERTGFLPFCGRLCLVMGLGRKGLPPSLLRSVDYHLELTGKNVPLETATVMGIIAERLSSVKGEMAGT